MEFLGTLTPGQFGAALAFLFFLFRLCYSGLLMEQVPATYRVFGPELASLALSVSVGLMANSNRSKILGDTFLLVAHILIWVLLWVWSKQRKATSSKAREWFVAIVFLVLGIGVYIYAVSRLWTSATTGGGS